MGIKSGSFVRWEQKMTVKTVISAGLATLSIIGNDKGRTFIIVGDPVNDVEVTKKSCAPGDVILTESSWQHISLDHYEYVFRDAYNVKV